MRFAHAPMGVLVPLAYFAVSDLRDPLDFCNMARALNARVFELSARVSVRKR